MAAARPVAARVNIQRGAGRPGGGVSLTPAPPSCGAPSPAVINNAPPPTGWFGQLLAATAAPTSAGGRSPPLPASPSPPQPPLPPPQPCLPQPSPVAATTAPSRPHPVHFHRIQLLRSRPRPPQSPHSPTAAAPAVSISPSCPNHLQPPPAAPATPSQPTPASRPWPLQLPQPVAHTTPDWPAMENCWFGTITHCLCSDTEQDVGGTSKGADSDRACTGAVKCQCKSMVEASHASETLGIFDKHQYGTVYALSSICRRY